VLALLAALVLVVGCSAAGAADRDDPVDTVARYDEALAPLKERSDVLEKRFAEVQGEGYTGPDQIRDVLSDIIPEYAVLLEKTREIEVEGAALEEAHRVLLESLERQQEGLELALEALDSDDSMRMVRAGRALEEAQRLVEEHRRLLARARRVG
jgi:predicted nuclease with TOPRIM domain